MTPSVWRTTLAALHVAGRQGSAGASHDQITLQGPDRCGFLGAEILDELGILVNAYIWILPRITLATITFSALRVPTSCCAAPIRGCWRISGISRALSGRSWSSRAIYGARAAVSGSSSQPKARLIASQALLPASPASPLPASVASTMALAVIVAREIGSIIFDLTLGPGCLSRCGALVGLCC